MHEVGAGHQLEQLAGEVARAANPGRSHVDLAGIALGVGNELGNGLGGNRRMNRQDTGQASDACNRRDVSNEIELKSLIERRIDRRRRRDEQQGIAIRRRMHDGLGGDIGRRAGAVLHHELLTEPLGEPSAQQARGDVISARGGKTDDQAHRPRRIALRPRNA